jgi:TRAP transporter TAXI family solute receptor
MIIEDNSVDGTNGDVSISRLLLLIVPALLILAGGLWFASSLIQPPPQKLVVISTGGESGAYHAFGKRYQTILAKHGIKSELKTSAGSIQNIQRLNDPNGTVSVALLQGGIATKEEGARLVSLGRVFYEPLWVFYKSAETFDRIAQLKGLKIAIGPEGSGTRKLATTLLTAANITDQNTGLLPITGDAAIKALKAGEADAILLAMAPEAPQVQDLLRDPMFKLMSMSQATALARVYPYLSRITLPQGVFDLERNIPSRDVELIAPVAALVARDDLHPALVAQLAAAAAEVHGSANLLTTAGEFPRTADPEFTVSPDAIRFYKNGPPFLQRYMPFWLANFLERTLVLLIPLATIMIPLIRGIPAFNRWRVNRKLTYWYTRLDKLEAKLGINPPTAAQERELATIERAVAALQVPRAYSEPYFNLRGHVDMVRARIGSRPAASTAPGEA